MVKHVLGASALGALLRGDRMMRLNLSMLGPSEVAVPEFVLARWAHALSRLEDSPERDGFRARLELVRKEFPRLNWTPQVTEHYLALRGVADASGLEVDDLEVVSAAHARVLAGVLVVAGEHFCVRRASLIAAEVRDWGTDAGSGKGGLPP